VLRLVCELDGETVLKVIPHIGYLHSSFEKLGEYRTWNQIVPLTDRMDYLSPLIYNCAYVMAVEKLMGIRGHRALQGVPRHPDGDGADLQPPAVAGHDRDRRGRVHARSCTRSRTARRSTRCTRSTAARASPPPPRAWAG
jgi:hypothetical protein